MELQLRSGADDCGCDFQEGGRCDLFSRSCYAYAKAKAGDEVVAWMRGLPDALRFNYPEKVCVALHGSAFEVADYIFRSTALEVKAKTFAAMNADVIVSGHSGLPFTQQLASNCWINAGAIGMPANKGNTRVWYTLLRDDEGVFFGTAAPAFVRSRNSRSTDA